MSNIDAFIAHGVTMKYQPDGKHLIDGKTPFVWQCTIEYNGKEFTCQYTKGAAYVGKRTSLNKLGLISYNQLQCELKKLEHGEIIFNWLKPIPPTINEVLFSLQCDIRCYLENPSWKDFCSEVGYDEDSRKGYKIYESCRETFQELHRLFFHYFDEFVKIDFEQ